MDVLKENAKQMKNWLYEQGFRKIDETNLGVSKIKLLAHPNGMKTILFQMYDDGGFNIWYGTNNVLIGSIKDEILEYIK